jgi:hypothetical protein
MEARTQPKVVAQSSTSGQGPKVSSTFLAQTENQGVSIVCK